MAKRSQLVVGQEWAFNRSRSNDISDRCSKVIIAAVEPYETVGYSGSIKTQKGLGVIVKEEGAWSKVEGGRPWETTVVQLSQLIMPWAEYEVRRAEYEARRKIWIEEAAIAKVANEKFQQEVYQPAYNEFIEAIEAISGKRLSSYEKVGSLPIEVLTAVAKLAKVGA